MSRLGALGALALAACSSPSLLERDVDPGSAIRVEILDDLVVVDGNPVPDADLELAIATVKDARGAKGRCAALVSVSLQPREDESPVDFDARLQKRKHDVIERLIQGGVRDLQLGPPSAPGQGQAAASR